VKVDYHLIDAGIPLGFWRSVGSSQNGWFTETFLDEVAAAGKKDPVELRLALLKDKPRWKKVVEVAAEKAGWGKKAASGISRGVAVVESFGSWVAQVAEISIDAGKLRVHRVVCVIDCGRFVNPDTIEAQMEGGIVYGLSSMWQAITIKDGRVAQRNFVDFPVVRMARSPKVEVHILESTEPPGGIGEPGVPPIAPAVTNAIFAATGKPIRSLPLKV
jgi:isoquinoline 1-oxidoreductase beta subunit